MIYRQNFQKWMIVKKLRNIATTDHEKKNLYKALTNYWKIHSKLTLQEIINKLNKNGNLDDEGLIRKCLGLSVRAYGFKIMWYNTYSSQYEIAGECTSLLDAYELAYKYVAISKSNFGKDLE